MLDALRRGAQSWVAKILFAILIVSFGIFWNVSDVITSGGGDRLAKVGSNQITVERYQRAFQNRIQQLSEGSKQRISTEMALQLGLDRQVLDNLIGQSALLAQSHDLGLAMSDAALVESLKQEQAFQGADGRFSRLAFDGFLRQTGYSETGFLNLYREDELRRQLSDALAAATVTPNVAVEERHQYTGELRNISHFNIDRSKVGAVPEPDEAKLREAYEQAKADYMAPEYRKLAVITLSVDDLMKDIPITDDELKAAYEETKDTYDKLERRRVQQIVFKDRASAEAARADIVAGKRNFLDVAAETGAKESDVNLGMLTKKQLIDPAIAEVAFKLERDAISEPIDGRFGIALVRVIEIEEGKSSTLDEVKDKVRDAIARKRAGPLMQERADQVEENRNAGRSFKEIAEALKLKLIEVDASRDNKTPDGQTALDLPQSATLLAAAFNAQPGDENEPVELENSAYAWYDLQAVIPTKLKEFDAVKEDVKKAYIESEMQKRISELAATLVERLDKGEDIAKVAADAGGTVETKESLRRDLIPPDLPAQAMRKAFALPKGKAGSSETSDRTTRVVFRVDTIEPAAPLSEKEQKDLETGLAKELHNDLLTAYVDGLKDSLGATVNEALLKRITGSEPP